MKKHEQSLLAHLIGGDLSINEVLEVLPPEDNEAVVFSGVIEKEIWVACVCAHRKGYEINPVTVSSMLPGDIDVDSLEPVGNAYEALDICREAWLKRKSRVNLEPLMRQLDDESPARIDDTLGEIGGTVGDLCGTGNTGGVKDALDIHRAETETYWDVEPYIPTGIQELDRTIGGLYNGNLVTIMGGTSAGKSVLIMDLAINAALTQKCPVLLFGLEMRAKDYVHRLWARMSGHSLSTIRSGGLSAEDLDRIKDRIKGVPLFVDDRTNVTAEVIASRAKTFKAQHPDTCMISVDYLQRIANSNSKDNTSESSTAGKAACLKNLALSCGVPVVTGSQVNEKAWQQRDRADRKPRLHDGKYANAIAEESDLVIGINRLSFEEGRGAREIAVLKHRQGPCEDYQNIFFDTSKVTFCPAGPHKERDL